MGGYRRLLPDATVLIHEMEAPGAKLDKVGRRYGVSRQAVHKAIKKYLDEQQESTQQS